MKVFRTDEINADAYQIGDVISFTLNDGEEAEAMAVKQEEDGMLFCFVDCLADEYPMNEDDTNPGGFDASDLRAVLNEDILDCLPDDLVEKLIAFDNGDALRIPTEREIFGKNVLGDDDYGEQWEAMKLLRKRIALQGKNGDFEWYWLMNRKTGSDAGFVIVGCLGSVFWEKCSTSCGVRPVFKIKGS